MVRWEYIWRATYWTETERSSDYITRIRYTHVWKPDLSREVPFPDQEGIDRLGDAGWEMVTVTTGSVTLLTVESPQGNNQWSNFPTHTLYFKRPRAD